MLVKEEHFRKYYKRPIVIKDQDFAHEIARTLQIDSIMDDDLTGEQLMERLESLEINEMVNSVIVVPYIDHSAGISFMVMTTATVEGSHIEIYWRDDQFSVMGNCRKDKVDDCEFDYLENLSANDDFDINDYEKIFEIVSNYHVNDDVEQLRFLEILDSSRHEAFPDDVEVLFLKEGMEIEKMWVRYEGIIEVPIIEATLMNTPFQDFGVKAGDRIKFFPYKTDDEEVILICNLDSKN